MKILNQHILCLEENKFRGGKKAPQYWVISFYSNNIPMRSMNW